MKVELIKYPTEQDWLWVKQCTLNTVGKKLKSSTKEVDFEWKKKLLESEHSPIRELCFGIRMEIPYWVSVHFVRHHIGVNHYVQTQRDDRQKDLDISRNDKPQGEIVSHIMSINAQELIQMSHKRLCAQASKETRQVMKQIVELVIEKYPEFKEVLVPLCVYRNNKCTEMFPCPKVNKFKQQEQHIKDTTYLFDIYESVIDELPFTITDLFQSKEDLEVYDRFYSNKPKEFENE